MKRIFIPSAALIVFLGASIIISSCGVSSSKPHFNQGRVPTGPTGQGGGGTSTTPNRNCGSKMETQAYKVAWSYSHCEPTDTVHVDKGTVNANGEALGDRSVDKGRIMFKITGMSNYGISAKETFGIFFNANGNGGGEVNWQWMSYHVGGDDIQSRIIIQRFDGTCSPKFCEDSFITDELQFRDPSEVWAFDCLWDGSGGIISCDITKASDKTTIHGENDPRGAYHSLRYIGVGANAFDGPYPGYNGTVSEFMLAIFE
ncbi:MAG: hypothetical protein OEV92_10395 [Nitrospinota bacterium]|nr:hypothetical protein [Nitrospinota bacterium]